MFAVMKRFFCKTEYNKIVFQLMAFAFFWMVIGDLITLHQKLIYGFDPFGMHQPFAKPGHSGKNLSKKNQKVFKVRDGLHFYFFLNVHNETVSRPFFVNYEYNNTLPLYKYRKDYFFLGLRSPPSL